MLVYDVYQKTTLHKEKLNLVLLYHRVIAKTNITSSKLFLSLFFFFADAIKASSPNTNNKEIEDCIKVWLKHAPQRLRIKNHAAAKRVC